MSLCISRLRFRLSGRKRRGSSQAKRHKQLSRRPMFETLEARNLLAIYYVDGVGGEGLSGGGNDGNAGTSLAAPFLTIGKANSILTAGDTVLIRGGTYNESIAPNNSGTASAKITYQGYNGEMPFVLGDGGNNPTKVNSRSYIVVDGFDLSTPNDTYGAAVIFRGNYNELRNSLIDNSAVVPGAPESTTTSPHSGIGLAIGKSKFNIVENTTISGWWVGVSANDGIEDLTFRNNVVTGNIATGIAIGPRPWMSTVDDPEPLRLLFEDNIIGGSLVSDGIQTESMTPGVVNVRGIIVRGNTFYFLGENALDFKSGGDIVVENNTFVASLGDNDGNGIRNTSTGNTTERWGAAIVIGSNRKTEQVIVRNNTFYDNVSGVVSGGEDWKIYNNTMVANNRDAYGWNSSYTGGAAIPESFLGYSINWSNSLYMNNIVVDQNDASVSIGNTPTYVPFRVDNNLYGNVSAAPKFLKGKDATLNDLTFSEWQTYLATFANVTGREQNSLIGDPQFVNVPRSASTFPYFNYTEAVVGAPVYPPELNFADLGTWFPYDFRLQAGSAAIDTGGFLTMATSAGNNSTTLQVGDSRVFTNGYGIAGEGDVIQIGSESPVLITSINYATDTITLAAARTWSNGANVSFPYNGNAPDIGAFEFAGGGGNTPPDAGNDLATTNQETSVTIAVLDNDTDANSDPLIVSAITQGANGTVVNNTTDVTYTPGPGFTGADSFSYTVSDGNGGFDTGTVDVTVNAVGSSIISENFADGSALGNFTEISGGDWSVIDGRLQVVNPGPPSGGTLGSLVTHNTPVLGDFELTVQGRVDATVSSWGDVSVAFNYQDADNYYFAVFNQQNGTATHGIFRVQNGVSAEIIDFDASSQVSIGTSYELKVVRTGNTIAAYLDGVLAGNVVDSTFSGGKIGLGSWNDAVSYDNLLVTSVSNLPGDFDTDNDVDGDDLNLWQAGYGTSSGAAIDDGDADADGDVDGFDFLVWQRNFGAAASNNAPVAVDDLATLGPGSSSYESEIVALNPVSYWRLGEAAGATAVDQLGVSDGTYVDGVVLGQTGAVVADPDLSAGFDGLNDYVEIAHNNAYLLDSGSISFWFKTSNTAQTGKIVTKDASGFGTGGHFAVGLNNGIVDVRLQSATQSFELLSTSSIVANVWQNVVFSFGSGGMSLYLNGQLEASDAYTGGLGNTSGGVGNFEPWALGAHSGFSNSGSVTPLGQFFDGQIDEVAMFGAALSPGQVQQLYDAATTPSSTGTIIDVLANDTDADMDPLTIDSVTQGAEGTVVNNGTDVTYTPSIGFTGSDTFTYTISDGNGGFDTATVNVTAGAQSRSQSRIQPYSGNPFYWQYEGQPIMLLGGGDNDDIHNWTGTQLTNQLDLLVANGGNYIRDVVTSNDNTTGNYAFKQISEGVYDLNQWNESWWTNLTNLLSEAQQRDIIVSFEIWNAFGFTDLSGLPTPWSNSPWNPKNNINYTEAGTGIPETWTVHPSQGNSPFIETVPGLGSNGIVLPYQEAFVREFIRRTLPYDNALYVIQNESNADFLWSDYWATVMHNEASLAGEEVEIADMRDPWSLTDPDHEYPIDRPSLYTFIEISQNNQNPYGTQSSSTDQAHYNNIQYIRDNILNATTLGDGAPVVRPMNNVKIYGANTNTFDPGSSDQRGTERFWRNVFGGAASVRLHRPNSGLGLGTVAQTNILSARMATEAIDIFSTAPDNSLLSNRSNDEAYALAADSGQEYAVYFTGDADGSVVLDVATAPSNWSLRWLDVNSSTWGNTTSLGDLETVALQRPGSGQWVAIVAAGSALELALGVPPTIETATSITTIPQSLVDVAAAQWIALGADEAKLSSLNIQIADLRGNLLGVAYEGINTILIDSDAAGQGWFVDKTPWDDIEFNADSPLGVELLSVLSHEMGHLLGLEHDDHSIMQEFLAAGTRNADLVDAVFAAFRNV